MQQLMKIIVVTSKTIPNLLTTSEMNFCQFVVHHVAINLQFGFIRIRFHALIYSPKYSKCLKSIAAQTSIFSFMTAQYIQGNISSRSNLFQTGSIEITMELQESRKSDSFEFSLPTPCGLKSYVII